jgi:hypothetical protein
MRLSTSLLWVLGLWIAAGLEAGLAGGPPGPLLLVGAAAGLHAGPVAGIIVGACAGVIDAALCGRDAFPLILLGVLGGLAASQLTRWFARTHLLVGVAAAMLLSFLWAFTLGLGMHLPPGVIFLIALRRTGVNALWMIAIYGIVLVASRRSIPMHSGEIS